MSVVVLSFLIICVTSYAIHLAACSFDDAADYLGRNLPPGVKGATLNAIASSLPEVFTTFFLLFYLGDTVGFASGLATCAGSAMFNMTIIPGVCILVTANAVRRAGTEITLNKKLLLRDVLFFVAAESILLYIVGLNEIGALLSGLLVLGYSFYAFALIRQVKSHENMPEGDRKNEADEELEQSPGRLRALLSLDTRNLLFPERSWTQATAIFVLLMATVYLGIACDFLATAVVDLAIHFDISPFFTAVILAAAGTSIPDMLLSMRDAQKGQYEDALSNAFGSNIFNIFVALGLPLLSFSLVYGPLELTAGEEMTRVRNLCISLIVVSIATAFILAVPKSLKKRHGIALLVLYSTWAITTVLPLAMDS